MLAAVLYVIAGLRDIFAPGFFNISPHVPDKSEIILQFALAAVFLALAASFSRTRHRDGVKKQ